MFRPSRRLLRMVCATFLAPVASSLVSACAHAAWSAAPVEVHATSAFCPLVSVCGDGNAGAIVVWQEDVAGGGLLRARRLLADGDLDPANAEPAYVCDRHAARASLGTVSDGAGGAYVWWTEVQTLRLTRLTPDLLIAEGWSAGGRVLGSLPSPGHRPVAKPDGEGGIYIGWLEGPFPLRAQLKMARFGRDGTAPGGWPASGRVVTSKLTRAFGFEPRPGGDVWVALCTHEADMFSGLVLDILSVERLAPSGLPAPGWSAGTMGLAFLDNAFVARWGDAASSVAITNDDEGGAYVVSLEGGVESGGATLRPRLRRIASDGSPSPGWTYDGVELYSEFASLGSRDPGADASVVALPDSAGGVRVGLPMFPAGATPKLKFARLDTLGAWQPGTQVAEQSGIEVARRDDGGLFAAWCRPRGPADSFDAPASIGVLRTDLPGSFVESGHSYPDARYGDVGVTALGDGGAIFAWSQAIDRQGVYAIRLNPAGVGPGPPHVSPTSGIRVWFAPGSGVRVLVDASTRVALRLHDVTGRQVARGTSEAAVGGEWTVPGTAALRSGVYFVRATLGEREVSGRVAVIR